MAVCIRQLRGLILNRKFIVRNIMTTPSKLEKVMENLQKNPYYDKYANRIAALQKTSPEEFLQRLEEQEKLKKEEAKKKFASVDTRKYSSVLNPKEPLKDSVSVQDKKLADIFKVELVKDKNSDEIRTIWEEYHKKKELVSATIPTSIYKTLLKRTQEHPTFLFPLPREQGYEFFLCQSHGHSLHFTSLLAFQVHKENAPECLTVVHYTELSEQGLILMRGEYDKNVLNGKEAQCLVNQFQLYYSGNDVAKAELVEKFTKSPDSFKHTDLITQLENISLT